MPKPTQAEVADLVGHLRTCAGDPMWAEHCEMLKITVCRAADAIEALAGEGAEPVAHRYRKFNLDNEEPWTCADGGMPKSRLQGYQYQPLYAAPPAKPAGELPPLPDALLRPPLFHDDYYTAEQMRAYALRALRERA